METIRALQDVVGLCWKCKNVTSAEEIHKIVIPGLGADSYFDGNGTEVHLCNSCFEESDPKIWNMHVCSITEPDYDYSHDEYEFEKDMYNYLNSLPLESQELVWNSFSFGCMTDVKLPPQDWIDYRLGILSHAKCKKYGLYSVQEHEEYFKRFPTCEYPINIRYDDGTTSCMCIFGAHGQYGQKAIVRPDTSCFECPYYKQRSTPLVELQKKDFKSYCYYKVAQVRHAEFSKKFSGM